MMKELFSREFDRSVKARRAEGVRFETMASDLDITVTTLHNWRHHRKANVSLDTLDQVADYFGWDVSWGQTRPPLPAPPPDSTRRHT